ncbi:MAG TPA: efflux RND transporter permease subunit [Candidatus Marinimicrobia bacterium]|jgi:Cu(I)/Ag(I) efflux system membrane protein CusA/SilA|nr:efflux RND transporter permease subunit [Candidatus Neomarinimicrobiota bacterium]MDP7121415.1 efflux RND transporter permease subunit [Candidatus Neomarinimicrobiota bacterium]MDP7484332.1 efflux RND transporter permease subunit [Candidatus Neomarinimicrobiota bacterium]MDP7716400.1 efflux RND transporter permease subunit [Candidatus Neomarinimicrobiota bacterium]HJL84168.1 efflux RND transporter permease subunit [Candidatus Neomarinimicrobiota bacterium]|tara:strand:+ start:4162 stop:7356 length:3195 start_codon:yes stop_codon:yes gene_type:complete
MIERIIEWSVHNRFIVIFAVLILSLGGFVAMSTIPLDAIPDLSDVQVIILTEYPGQAPQVVEDQVTYPLTTAMLSVPFAKVVRGYSFFGLSFVYIIFEDDTDMYWARSRVLEYLNFVSGRLPQGVTPQLGPDATGVGWVYEYMVESDRHDLQQLRSIQDWYLRYELMSVPGVTEVASIGGYVKQYQVEVDPNKLLAFNIPLNKVRMAIQRSNNDVGGKLIEMSETEFIVRGLGYIRSLDDLKKIALGVDTNGTPILLRNVANIHLGPDLRRGLADRDGLGETVGGIIVMRYGENALKVIEDVRKKIDDLKSGLPEGVEIMPAYDRSLLIERAIDNLKEKLLEESVVVALVCIVFLLHFRSAFVAIFTLPVGILISFLIMRYQGINANIMSLGGIAIAIGAMVDAAIVMIENAHKHIERNGGKGDHWQTMIDASKEVGPALFYSLLIITFSFLPVFSLQAQEGRLFTPLAFTKTYAMAASALLAITIVPVLMGYFIKGKILPEEKNPINRFLIRVYRPCIRFVLKFRKTTLAIGAVVLAVTIIPVRNIGSEFMPPLNEGDLLYMPTTDPGISITKARELLQQTDKIIRTFPEVERVFGKIGRAETATDPAPLSMIETTITLKQQDDWPRRKIVSRWYSGWKPHWLATPFRWVWPEHRAVTMDELVAELNATIQFPGLTNAWTMPIKTRIDMLSTGIKTPVGIKLMGADLDTLNTLGARVQVIVQKLPGTLSAFADKVTGGNFLDFEINRDEVARYGLTVGDVQDIIQSAVGGMNVSFTVEGLERYPINVRYSRELRDSISKLKRVIIPTPTGAQIPISQVADIRIRKGAPVIKSENARHTAWVYVDISGIDIGTYVKRAQQAVKEELDLPEGYSVVWSGQYEYMERAAKRLRIVVPVTLLIIFLLLYLNFKNVTESLIVMLSLPFSLVGGFWFIYFLGYNMSVAVGVGFIALAGVAAETGVVMLIYLDHAYEDRVKQGEMRSLKDLYEAVMEGAVERVRPKMMTVTAIIAGLLPILWGHGTGSQVMKRIASPMVGGMITSTILTLLVIPTIYYLWRSVGLSRNKE